jgi:uncharacterized protein YkwD
MQHLLQPRTFVLGALIAVSLIGFSPTAEAATQTTHPLTVADIISVTNTARTENGLAPLATSTLLIKSAQMKAEAMLSGGYFAHTNPAGARFWTLISAVGYTYAHAGENLAIGYSSKEALSKPGSTPPRTGPTSLIQTLRKSVSVLPMESTKG